MEPTSGPDPESTDAIDFAVAAYREDGEWQVSALPPGVATQLETLAGALSQLPADAGVLGMVSVDEDYFVLVRVNGDRRQLLLSDVGAATESPLAWSVVQRLDLPEPDDDDDQIQPAGDLSILADLGIPAMDLGAMCDDDDLYPDEVLADVARRLGFGPRFDQAVEEAGS